MTTTYRQFKPSAMYVAMLLSLPIASGLAQTSNTPLGTTVQVQTGFIWSAVANSNTDMPKSNPARKFSSFNQPSVNSMGLVVLRARGKGEEGQGEPLRGVYTRQMGGIPGPLVAAFDTLTAVPEPNNVLYSEQLGTFTEFPAFPRIGMYDSTVVTRGQSKPVWKYLLPDGSETRVGTSGAYAANLSSWPPTSKRVSAATQLGPVPGFDYYSVPGAPAGTKFDQFPGAPAVAGRNTVVFKGNYTDGVVPKTGIFFRVFDFLNLTTFPVQVIASSNTLIPGQTSVRFGSTAPPSASPIDAVFLGLDNEEAPTMGGIYRAWLASNPKLQPLVTIGSKVPGELTGVNFNRLGEALSYDGRFVAFWGAWGDATQTITLKCPEDGQKDVIAFCMEKYPSGLPMAVPTNQGFFVHDAISRVTYAVAKTGAVYKDFLYWTFSGRPPGVGDSDSEDFEEPRWRSAAFVSTFGPSGKPQVAFKGRKVGDTVTDGIYLTAATTPATAIRTVVETGMDGSVVDPLAAGIPVTTVGLERDGLRNGWLAIAAGMANDVKNWAGVYLTRTSR